MVVCVCVCVCPHQISLLPVSIGPLAACHSGKVCTPALHVISVTWQQPPHTGCISAIYRAQCSMFWHLLTSVCALSRRLAFNLLSVRLSVCDVGELWSHIVQ